MEETTDIGEGAISMFLSVIDELTKNGIGVIGTKPKLNVERDKLEKSGFFKYMEGKIEAKNSITKNTILRTGGKSNTHIDLSFEIKNANETVWGTKGRNPPLRGTVFEMMRNSHDHAFKNENSVIWHLGISHDEENKQVKFSFVDNGRGIIKSFSEGFLGKLFGPIGAFWNVYQGKLVPEFLWINVGNDLVWLPGFFLILFEVYSAKDSKK